MSKETNIQANKILVVMPNWLGDAVMATPFLRSLRGLYPQAQIVALGKSLVQPVLDGLPYVNQFQPYPQKKKGEKNILDAAAATRWIKDQKFDLAILLPNSFRSAWMAWRAGIPNRIGYARECRSLFLTHKLKPIYRTAEQRKKDQCKSEAIKKAGVGTIRVGSAYQPIPTIDYYLKLLSLLGPNGQNALTHADKHMELAATEQDRAIAEEALRSFKIETGERYAVLVPGANFGSSKCWPPEHFATIANAIADPHGSYRMKVILASSPAERPIIDAILKYSAQPERIVALANLNGGKGIPLNALKEIVRNAKLMICNDTGPRHFAAAFGVPIITLFGPTDPRWAETFVRNEKQIVANVPCGPCQLKKCPIDHRCMKGITAEAVLEEMSKMALSA